MSEAENKALVRGLLDELRGGWRPATIEKYFAPGYRRHLSATSTPLTREEQRQRATRLRVAFPDAEAWGGLDQPDLIRQMRGLPSAA
jgi:hypothetical protein